MDTNYYTATLRFRSLSGETKLWMSPGFAVEQDAIDALDDVRAVLIDAGIPLVSAIVSGPDPDTLGAAPRDDETAGGRYPTPYGPQDVRYWLTRGFTREDSIFEALTHRAARARS